ncbi:hypothetical protein L1887_51560 [Cichorium endivia]|nr:hypothetical protein L1887_51560 [Cichorium endivia]
MDCRKLAGVLHRHTPSEAWRCRESTEKKTKSQWTCMSPHIRRLSSGPIYKVEARWHHEASCEAADATRANTFGQKRKDAGEQQKKTKRNDQPGARTQNLLISGCSRRTERRSQTPYHWANRPLAGQGKGGQGTRRARENAEAVLPIAPSLPPPPRPLALLVPQTPSKMTSTAAKILKNATSGVLRLGMMPADGIGREVLPCAQRVLQNTPGAPKFEFVHLDAGFEHFQKTGSALPEETVRALKDDCHGAMFGSVSSPSHKVEGYSSPIVKLRKELDLYANIRPVIGVRGTKDDDKFIDSVIIRENTECLYIKSETSESGPDGQIARAIRQITEKASTRIGKKAFEVAIARKELRKVNQPSYEPTVTICHKSQRAERHRRSLPHLGARRVREGPEGQRWRRPI